VNPVARLLIAAIALSLTVGPAGCSRPASSPQPAKARDTGDRVRFPVETARVEAQRVKYEVTAVGSVEAFEDVQVTARVAGAVERVHFTEGQVVEQHTVLAEIEPERYRLAVESARAAVEKAEAARTEAQAALSRREQAEQKNPGLIIGEELEGWRTRVETAGAEVAQARAELQLAELNLRDAFARAPVSGTIQTRTVRTGEYVQPGRVLATLLQREPLQLRFSVPEQDAPRLAPGMAVQFRVQGISREFTSSITHVGGSADPASRMVTVTSRVTDPQRTRLRPGAFADVRVPVGAAVDAPVVPQTAIRPSERGFLAYVVEDDTARERIVTLGLRTPDGLVEIRSGIALGEEVVVRGAESLRDGAAVRVATGSPARDAAAPEATP